MKLKKRSEPSEIAVHAHEFVGAEGAVEVLQQLPDRVVVAVAEKPVVHVVVARPEAPDAQVVVGVLDLLQRPRDVVERHRSGGVDTAAGGLAHLRTPAVVGPHHGRLQLGIDAVHPEVVLGAVDDHDVDAFDLERLGDPVAGEALGDDLLTELLDHVVGGPVDRLLELPVEDGRVLGPAPVDRHRVVRVETGRRPTPDPMPELLVEEAIPEIRGIDHVGIRVENLEAVLH